jgi:hypothetical protein
VAEQSRWWDKYYVRYFVGTVYAVPLLLALPKDSPARSLLAAVPGSNWGDAAIVTAAGLAFCYLASAPILLLHALRVRIGRTARPYNGLGKVFGLVTLFAGMALAARSIFGIYVFAGQQWPLVPYFVVLGLEIAGLAGTKAEPLRSFYADLARRRKPPQADSAAAANNPGATAPSRASDPVPQETVDDYVESYRHLREHGNALLIIIMENCLALALWQAHDAATFFGVVAVWVLPGAFAWFLGTWLERGLAEAELGF